jgi:hypothetical protein
MRWCSCYGPVTPIKNRLSASESQRDNFFYINYQNCILIVSQYELSNDNIGSEDFLKALKCLETLSGRKPKLYLGDVVGYESRDDLRDDINAWCKWYHDNPSFRDEQAMKLFTETGEHIEWPKLVFDLYQ